MNTQEKLIDLIEDFDNAMFVTVSGECRIVDDQVMIDELWNESWQVWFPGGKTDPSVVLLKIQPEHGGFWDNSGASGLKYLVSAGTAYLQGERAEIDESINASVAL